MAVHRGPGGFAVPLNAGGTVLLDERGLFRLLRSFEGSTSRCAPCRAWRSQAAGTREVLWTLRAVGFTGEVFGPRRRVELSAGGTVREMDEDQTPAPEPRPDGYFLIDPAWQPQLDSEQPPIESVVGLWPLEADSSTGLPKSRLPAGRRQLTLRSAGRGAAADVA